ncbi:MAG: Uma2 family endonuclease [Sphingomonas sp.]|jgi:Uma2 family endonuclease
MSEVVPLTRTPRAVKLRVEDYLALDAMGAFDAYGKTELIEGEVVYMNAQHRPHARIKTQLLVRLANALEKLGSNLEALVDGSVAMPPHNVPEPDISLTDEPEGPGLIPLASLALVIEVADTTLRNDLGRKQRIYAREGVPEYWVVDIKKSVIHQLWSPGEKAYGKVLKITFGNPITAVTIPGLTIDTDTV